MSLLMIPAIANSTVFEYSYGDPYLASSQAYISSTTNAELATEGVFKYWKPTTGASTLAATSPGEITYHFDFDAMGYTDPMSEISLGIFMPAFHWSYSQGYNVLSGSTDGTTWIKLAETPPVAFSDYESLGPITGLDSLLGGSDLWLRAELYSYGPSASRGGAMTNTAQLSRYDTNRGNPTFRLQVAFEEDEVIEQQIPEPATLALMGLGLAAIGYRRLSSKKAA